MYSYKVSQLREMTVPVKLVYWAYAVYMYFAMLVILIRMWAKTWCTYSCCTCHKSCSSLFCLMWILSDLSLTNAITSINFSAAAMHQIDLKLQVEVSETTGQSYGQSQMLTGSQSKHCWRLTRKTTVFKVRQRCVSKQMLSRPFQQTLALHAYMRTAVAQLCRQGIVQA